MFRHGHVRCAGRGTRRDGAILCGSLNFEKWVPEKRVLADFSAVSRTFFEIFFPHPTCQLHDTCHYLCQTFTPTPDWSVIQPDV